MCTCTFSWEGSRRKEEGGRGVKKRGRREREGEEGGGGGREKREERGRGEEVLPSPNLRTNSADSFLNLFITCSLEKVGGWVYGWRRGAQGFKFLGGLTGEEKSQRFHSNI